MTTREEHQKDYKPDAWKQYSNEEYTQWVALLMKRATHRSNLDKALKDLDDAKNYLEMMRDRLVSELSTVKLSTN